MTTEQRKRMTRTHPEFFKDWKEVQRERYGKGLDEKPISFARFNLAIMRIPQWKDWKETMKKAKFNRDKLGQSMPQTSIFYLYVVIVVALLTVVLFGGFIYVTGLLNNVFQQVGVQTAGASGIANLTDAANKTFGQLNSGVQSLRMIAFVVIICEFFLFLMINAFARRHPVLFFVYVLVVLLGVLLAAPISNAYAQIENSNLYEGLLSSFTGSNWILLHLPLVVAVFGILAGIFMFINIIRGGEQVAIE